MQKIEPLKKIKLSLEAGTSRDVADLQLPASEFEFIFGLGPEGLSPLECDLAEKTVGDNIVVHLGKQNLHEYIAHVQLPVHTVFENRDSIFLAMRVEAINQADSREVVRTMAQMTGHGTGCGVGCDCGCGC